MVTDPSDAPGQTASENETFSSFHEEETVRSYLGVNRSDSVAILHNLLLVAHKVMSPFNTYLQRQYDISINEFRVLMVVGRLEMTASHEVANLSGLSSMGVSRAVRGLMSRDWISGEEDASNRRRIILRLTDAGQDVYAQMQKSTQKVSDYLLEPLSERHQMRLHQILIDLIEHVEEQDEQGESLFLKSTRPD